MRAEAAAQADEKDKQSLDAWRRRPREAEAPHPKASEPKASEPREAEAPHPKVSERKDAEVPPLVWSSSKAENWAKVEAKAEPNEQSKPRRKKPLIVIDDSDM